MKHKWIGEPILKKYERGKRRDRWYKKKNINILTEKKQDKEKRKNENKGKRSKRKTNERKRNERKRNGS